MQICACVCACTWIYFQINFGPVVKMVGDNKQPQTRKYLYISWGVISILKIEIIIVRVVMPHVLSLTPPLSEAKHPHLISCLFNFLLR